MPQRSIGAPEHKSAPPVSRQTEPIRIYWRFCASAAAPAVAAIIGARPRTIAAVVALTALPVASALICSRDRSDRTGDDREHRDGRGGVVAAPVCRCRSYAHGGDRNCGRCCEREGADFVGKHFALL